MTFMWIKEDSPRWDADKQRLFGQAELAAVGLASPAPGEPVANEWWRVTDGGDFILEHLEAEAAARGLNYIYNIVPATHPDGPWITNWLSSHGFREASRGQLRRRVEPTPAVARAQPGEAPR